MVHDAAGRVVFNGTLGTQGGVTLLPSEAWTPGAYSAVVEGHMPIRFILR